MTRKKQIDKNSYGFHSYCSLDRWSSYFYQIQEVMRCEPKNILEVGVGNKVFANYLLNNTDVEYNSLDIDGELQPNIVGSVEDIPVEDGSFDVVCAFEVLEHLPFEEFEKCLLEMKRVSRKYVILSLPDASPSIKLLLKFPVLIYQRKWSWKVPFPKEHKFNGQHYWEIGKKGYSASRVRAVLKKHFNLKDDFVPFENQYHHFFILEKPGL